jgi:TrmH family RNA methyltransferase
MTTAEDLLAPIASVLVETSHPGNIGSAARALKTMGLSVLRLVHPAHFPHPEATAMASGADDILAAAQMYPTLRAAVADARLVIGSSDRQRGLPLPLLDPREFADCVLEAASAGPVAVVYGTERTGLTNEQLELCRYLVRIPGNPAYGSLNLAAAVQVLSWELRVAALARVSRAPTAPAHRPAPAEQLERFFDHLARVLTRIGFFGDRSPVKIMRRIRRLYLRAAPDERELQILRGILTETEASIDGRNPRRIDRPAR